MLPKDCVQREVSHRLERALRELLGTDDLSVGYEEIAYEDPAFVVMEVCRRSADVVVAYSTFKRSGAAVMMVELERAREFFHGVLKTAGFEEFLPEDMVEDMVRELGNEIIGAAISALARSIGRELEYSIPRILVEECSAVVGELAATYLYGYGGLTASKLAVRCATGELPVLLLIFAPEGW